MKSQIASGAGWMLLFRLIDRVLGIASTLVLARLLVPADFGLVAMAMSVLTIIEQATYLNFDTALIQRREVTRDHYDTAWTLNVAFATVCAVVAAALAYPAALFYDEPRLLTVLLVLAAGWLLGGFENVGVVDFRRKLDFRSEFDFLVAKRVASFGLTLALALTLKSYWALISGMVAGRLLGVGLSYLLHPFRPRPGLRHARDLLGFSSWMLASNLLNTLQSKVPHFTVGRLLGASPLGVFTIASEIAQLPSSDLMAPINRAVFPGFSRMADDPDRLRSTFVDVSAVVLLIAVPAAVGIGVVADPLVRALLGEKWLDAVPLIQVLSLASAVTAVVANNSTAFLAIGRPRLLTAVMLLRLCVLIPAVVLLTSALGLLGAALAELIASVCTLLVSVPILFSRLRLSYRSLLSRLWRPTLASAIMAAAVNELQQRMPDAGFSTPLVELLASVATGALVYPAAVMLMWSLTGRPEGAESLLLRRFAPRLNWARRAGNAER